MSRYVNAEFRGIGLLVYPSTLSFKEQQKLWFILFKSLFKVFERYFSIRNGKGKSYGTNIIKKAEPKFTNNSSV